MRFCEMIMTNFEIIEKEYKEDTRRRIIFKKSKILGKSSREILDKRVVIAATLQAEKYIEKLQKGGLLSPEEVKSLFMLGKIASDNPVVNQAIFKHHENLRLNNQKTENTEIIKQNIFSKLLGASK